MLPRELLLGSPLLALISLSVAPVLRMPSTRLAHVPFAFTENLGQLDPQVRFHARSNGVAAYLTRDGFVLQIGRRSGIQSPAEGGMAGARRPEGDGMAQGVSLFFTFEGVQGEVLLEGARVLPGRAHYFLGSESCRWQTELRTFGEVRYEEIYPRVDVIVYDRSGVLEYDVALKPGADLGLVVIRCDGADSLSIDEEGALLMRTPLGDLRQDPPRTYEVDRAGRRSEVDSRFRLLDANHYGFDVARRDAAACLVIDPGLAYSTYLGGSGTDTANAVAVNNAGEAYLTGWTLSPSFPTTAGAFDTSHNGGTDVFVVKMNAAGTAPLFSTFLGGSNGGEQGNAITLDNNDNAYITGSTIATDFPTTSNAFDRTYNGGPFPGDAFVAKLSSDGSLLLYSSYLGGNSLDAGYGIALDASRNAYVTGWTQSTNLPVAGFDITPNGSDDAFVFEINAVASGIIYGAYLGGSGPDVGRAIAVDSATLAAFVTGTTGSSDFPTTPGAYDTTYSSGDAFVTKVGIAGLSLDYSTFLGGGAGEDGLGIALRNLGGGASAFVCGTTLSTNFPVTSGAFDMSPNGGLDAFAARLSPGGNSLTWATYLGGSGDDGGTLQARGLGIAVDAAGAVYLAGITLSSNFPVTSGAIDMSANGSQDAFLAKLAPAGSVLEYSTYLGGPTADRALGVALDDACAVYVVGDTGGGYPTTSGAFDESFNGTTDAFLCKVILPSPTIAYVTPDHGPSSGISGIVLTGSGLTGATQVRFGPNLATSFSVDSDTQITVNLGTTTTLGFVDVSVTTSTCTAVLADGFDYFTPPREVGDPCGSPYLTWSGFPTLGETYTVTTNNLDGHSQLMLLDWSSVPRPFRKALISYLNCPVYVRADSVSNLGMSSSYNILIPNQSTLIGAHVLTQAVVLSNPRQTTQALDAIIGE